MSEQDPTRTGSRSWPHRDVKFDVEGSVATITLAAAQRRNAIDAAMVDAIVDACDRIDSLADVGAVVLRAEGPSFCAGADRRVLAGRAADPLNRPVSYRAFTRLTALSVPMVAAVRGTAVGAGLNLALLADLRVVADDAVLTGGFGRNGIHPGGGFFALVGRLGGREQAAALGLFGQSLTGSRAVQLGLASEAVRADEVDTRAFELAAVAAADPALARALVRTFRITLGPPALAWGTALQVEENAQSWSLRRAAAQLSQTASAAKETEDQHVDNR